MAPNPTANWLAAPVGLSVAALAAEEDEYVLRALGMIVEAGQSTSGTPATLLIDFLRICPDRCGRKRR